MPFNLHIPSMKRNEINVISHNSKFDWTFSPATSSEWIYINKAINLLDENGRIVLSPWCGCSNPDSVAIDATNDTGFDWSGFAEEHIKRQIFKNQAKIDVYDQIMYGDRFSNLVDELWYTRLPYERDNPKFHRIDSEVY